MAAAAALATPALYPAFFFVLEKAVKSAGNAVIPTFPMYRSYGFQHLRHKRPRSLSRAKVGTHSAFGEGSHTRAHRAKHGAFRMGVVSLPSARSACCRNAGRPLVKTTHLPFSWSGYFFVDFSGINYAPIRNLENLKTILIFLITCGMVALLEIKPLHRSYYVGKL